MILFPARLSRRRSDHRQPLHPAGFAFRVRAGGPAVPRNGLPMLAGMALTFAAVATLGRRWRRLGGRRPTNMAASLADGASGAVRRCALLFPALSERMTRPLVALGEAGCRDRPEQGGAAGPFWPSLLLGVATGLLWAPCAGPILGLILTGAALKGRASRPRSCLWPMPPGAATSLALALLIGGRVFAAMKRLLGAGEWIRRGLGAAVLAGVAAIALGLDTGSAHPRFARQARRRSNRACSIDCDPLAKRYHPAPASR